MIVSFVVPAYNEAALLGRTLDALHVAGRALAPGIAYEIVVVDDGSTDGTGAVAQAHGARVLRSEARQIAAARNAGARASVGEALVFVDADTVVTPEAVRGAVSALAAGAAGGGAAVRFDGRLPAYVAWALPLALWTTRTFRWAAGCFFFCSRKAFEATGGFDEGVYAGEELYMSQALKRVGRFVVLREPVVTSGRRLRAYSGREAAALLFGLAIRGRRGVADRARVADWYDARRPDPDAPAETT